MELWILFHTLGSNPMVLCFVAQIMPVLEMEFGERVFFFVVFCFCFCFFICLSSLQPFLQHMEVPGLGVAPELPLRPVLQPQPQQMQATSAIYTAACGNAGSLTR